MTELFTQKIQAVISIISLMTSWFIAQISVIEQGFDQLFSLGLLIVAVVVIWKAFSKKDESETKIMNEQIELYKDMVKAYKESERIKAETIEHLREQLKRERNE